MTITIPDAVLREAGITERDVLVEAACRLFDDDRLSKFSAAQLCGLDRPGFEAELRSRNLAVYRTTLEDYKEDLETLRRLGQAG